MLRCMHSLRSHGGPLGSFLAGFQNICVFTRNSVGIYIVVQTKKYAYLIHPWAMCQDWWNFGGGGTICKETEEE